MASLFADQEKGHDVGVNASDRDSSDEEFVKDGDIAYKVAESANTSIATYQDARGAPVEKQSPLGYSVNTWVSLCLNINQMIGTGIFSTRKTLILAFWLPSCDMRIWFADILLPQSGHDIERCRVGGFDDDILVYRIFAIPEYPLLLPGAIVVLSQSFWIRRRIPGTSISETAVLLPHGICHKACYLLVFKQQRNCFCPVYVQACRAYIHSVAVKSSGCGCIYFGDIRFVHVLKLRIL